MTEPHPAGPRLLDRDHLGRYTGGDAALEAELYGLLRGQIHSTLDALGRTGGDEQLWRRLAHTLKGASRGVGAFALGEACAQAEDRPHDAAALDAIRKASVATIEAIDAALVKLKAA